MPDKKKKFSFIDFEEMEEFVAEQKALRNRQRKMSVSSTIPDYVYYKNKVEEESSGEDSGIRYGLGKKATRSKDGENRESRPKNPDRFTFFFSYMDSTIHVREFGDLLDEEETFEGLFRGDEGVWWLDCFNPTKDEQRMLLKAFREGVLSFHFNHAPYFTNVRRRIAKLRDYVALSSEWICYALIDDITDSFGAVIHDIEQETDAIENAVFGARTGDHTFVIVSYLYARKMKFRSTKFSFYSG